MLLRRVTQHVKDQNWFAVLLDFAIVVFGVLLAIQVSNWNDARSDRRAEREILQRLHFELQQADALRTAYQTFAAQRLSDISTARLVLLGLTDRDTLTVAECQAVSESHIPVTPFTIIPIITELSGSGELAILRDQRVVSAIAEVTSQNELESVILSGNVAHARALAPAFPELIAYGLERDEGAAAASDFDGFDPVFLCDSGAMRESSAFLNAFGENATRVFFMLEYSTQPKHAAIEELRLAVEAALGEQ
ncbi:MAG: hypothetical protein AAFX86_09110 [Pseudomonadota bacterium]